MPTPKTKGPKRMASRAVEAEVFATAHRLTAALHRVGAVSDVTMRDMERMCLPVRPDYEAAGVKRIRAAAKMSQPMFARLLGVEKSSVAQWEAGTKRPSGPVLRLLEMLDPEKPESPVVQVRREMVRA